MFNSSSSPKARRGALGIDPGYLRFAYRAPLASDDITTRTLLKWLGTAGCLDEFGEFYEQVPPDCGKDKRKALDFIDRALCASNLEFEADLGEAEPRNLAAWFAQPDEGLSGGIVYALSKESLPEGKISAFIAPNPAIRKANALYDGRFHS